MRACYDLDAREVRTLTFKLLRYRLAPNRSRDPPPIDCTGYRCVLRMNLVFEFDRDDLDVSQVSGSHDPHRQRTADVVAN
jgi:hypothetical protein